MNELALQNQELIKISETEMNNVKVQTVNARELHSFLEVGRDFSNWIKGRISTLGSIEGEDYTVVLCRKIYYRNLLNICFSYFLLIIFNSNFIC